MICRPPVTALRSTGLPSVLSTPADPNRFIRAYPAPRFFSYQEQARWALVNWLGRVLGGDNPIAFRDRVTASILDANDGITSSAGIAEGFLSAGASTATLLFAGTALILAGGSAAAGARYSEVRTEWELDHAQVEAERASIEADPAGEF